MPTMQWPSSILLHSIMALVLLLCTLQMNVVTSFVPPLLLTSHSSLAQQQQKTVAFHRVTMGPFASSSTALGVWWFGGTESAEPSESESCELVPVRIERPSPSSRRIFGEIVAPLPLDDVWAILTDYDRLAQHVPNLKESRITKGGNSGRPGDGQYQCRLFQKGAQKIVGFEFGASVTMDMKELTISDKERHISFKCADSFFFTVFDGVWKAQERTGENGQVETLLSYIVDVRPKGPVPVAALEWRIREDVPTNLRAIKRAAALVGQRRNTLQPALSAGGGSSYGNVDAPRNTLMKNMKMNVKWYRDETMAAYLVE